ncbi:hypothetical protein EPO05_00470 [Patescibacteria group bacterium]|nr:MAG: hypothetical protein EPO05_00470 [Patescibacteria group bacterium]
MPGCKSLGGSISEVLSLKRDFDDALDSGELDKGELLEQAFEGRIESILELIGGEWRKNLKQGLKFDTADITYLTPQVARELANWPHVERSGIKLSGVKYISAGAAEELARSMSNITGFIVLPSLKGISLEATKALVHNYVTSDFGLRGGLSMRGLETLTLDEAGELAKLRGGWLELGKLQNLTPEIAQALAGLERGILSIDSTHITPQTARELIKFKGSVLGLNGLETIDLAVAQELAPYPGKLMMRGLSQMSNEAASCLRDKYFDGKLLLSHGLSGKFSLGF